MGAGAGFGSSERFHLVRTLVASQPDRYHKQHRYDKFRDLPEAEYPIWAMAIAEVNLLLAVASADAQVHIWDLDDYELRVSLKAHEAVIWDVVFSPNELVLATASGDKTIRLWEPDTGTPIGLLFGHTDCVKSLSFSPDGFLLSGGMDCQVAVWEFDNVEPVQIWKAHEGGVFAVSFSPADTSLAIAIGADGSVSVWCALDGAEGLLARFPGGDGGGVLCLAAHPIRYGVVATGIEDGGVWLWFFKAGQLDKPVTGHHHLRGHAQAVWSLDFAMDGTVLVSGSSDRNARVWGVVELEEPMLLCVFTAHDTWVRCVKWHFGTDALASASTDGTVSFWLTPKKVRKFSYRNAADVKAKMEQERIEEEVAADGWDPFDMGPGMDMGPEMQQALPWQEPDGSRPGSPISRPASPSSRPASPSARPASPSAGIIRPISPSGQRLARMQTRSAAGLVSKLQDPMPSGDTAARVAKSAARVVTTVSSWARPNVVDPLSNLGSNIRNYGGNIFGSTPLASPNSTGGWPTSAPTPKATGPLSTTMMSTTGMSGASGVSGASDPPVMVSDPPPPPTAAFAPPGAAAETERAVVVNAQVKRPPPPPPNAPQRARPAPIGTNQPAPPPPDAPLRVTPMGSLPRAPNYAPPNRAVSPGPRSQQPAPPPLPTL